MVYPGSLHNHTEYSNIRLRDCIIKHEDLIDYAIELGHEVVAITDHECISNAIKVEKYYKKIKQKNPNFKVILGNEIYLVRDGLTADNYNKEEDRYYHFILLAKDAIGHQQIREISTKAWMRSYFSRRMRRVPTYYQDLIDIIGKNPGHVIGSTACLGGFIPTKLLQYRKMQDKQLLENIKNWLLTMYKLFNNNFYLELQPSKNDEQIYVNRQLINLSKELSIKYIITTDSHYLKKEDASIHKAYLNSQDGDREVDAFYATTYMMSTEELESYLDLTKEELETAYQTILDIKNSCEDYSLLKPLKIPELIWKVHPYKEELKDKYTKLIPYLIKFYESSYKGDNVLACAIVNKLDSDKRLQNQKTYNAVEECLRMTWISSEVNKAHWSAYYLNLQNIIDTCWEAGSLVGPGRGSGVGFILLYLLDITQINPLWETVQTFPWRFLNPSRVSVLDVDFDIEGGRRSQVLNKFREIYGEDRVANVITFGTEKSKSAILTAARGLGIDVDEAQYIASLIPADRGLTRTLKQCYYGDKDNGFSSIPLFIKEMDSRPELWQVAQKIEGLVCRCGIHAGGVIFVDEPFTNSTALMRAPDSTIITAFDLHDAESVSLIKYDALSVEAEDKLHTCIDLLVNADLVTAEPTLKETYEKIIGIYNLERDDPKMWKMVWEHKILSLFQMEKQSGIQGIALTKPQSVEDLAHLNSVIRLMAQEKGAEQPLNKFARFKDNIELWYTEMRKYGLTEKEIELLKPYIGGSYGICESQEAFMQLVQIPECGGFDLNFADRLRKSIAKKNPIEYEAITKEYFEKTAEKGLSKNLCNYVWNVLVATSRGYGFNLSHTLAYSLVALQEMNIAYHYPLIYWNCACLITDSGAIENKEDEEDFDSEKKEQNTNYDKIAKAIGKMRDEGVNINIVDINKSAYSFVPDAENNTIWFGLKGMLRVGDDLIETIIKNRPYFSVKDFYNRVHPNKAAMVSLIKGGAFDSLMDRKECMVWYIWETCDKKKRLTLQNMATLNKFNLLPKDTEEQQMAYRIYEFNRYLKSVCKKDNITYSLDERALNFLTEIDFYNYDNNELNAKIWDKVYQIWMDIYRNWLSANQQEILTKLNDLIFMEDWNKYAQGSYSAWEMETLCFYYHPHEMINVNKKKYGLSDYFNLSEEPIVAKTFYKAGRQIPIFELTKIAGTCIAKDKTKGLVTLLTTTGVVDIKFSKEYFSLFDKQISIKNPDGTKTIVERSWFNRGKMIMVQGMRRGDNFVAKKYASSGGHQLYKINEIKDNGDLVLTHERYKGDIEEDDG